MKEFQVGNIVKTKKGDKCIIVDIEGKEAFVFNLSKMEPQTINISNIKEKVGDSNSTTIIVNGKKVVRKKDEDEPTESANEAIEIEKEENTENEKTNEENKQPTEALGELVKLFGKAAIELGNIFTNLVEDISDDPKE